MMADGLQEWNDSLTVWLIPNNVFLVLYLIIGTFGNSLVLFIYLFRMKSGKDDRYFIPSLALMDLLACIIGSGYALSLNLLPVRFPGDSLCKFLWFLSQSTTIASSLLLVVIAIHRYMKVCRPLIPKWSLRNKRIAVGVTIFTSIFISLPTFAFYGEIEIFNSERNLTGYRCSNVHTASTLDLLVIYNITLFIFALLGIIAISVLYSLIGKSIYSKVLQYRKSFRRPKNIRQPKLSVSTDNNVNAFRSNGSESATSSCQIQREALGDRVLSTSFSESGDDEHFKQNAGSKTNSLTVSYVISASTTSTGLRSSRDLLHVSNMKHHFQHYRYSYMFMTIACVFVISYLPRIVVMLLESISASFWMTSDRTISAMLFLYRMYILNHVTNPFIYGFFDGSFRHEVKLLLCKCRNQHGESTMNNLSSQ